MLKNITGVFFILTACTSDPSPPLTPDEELATFQIAPGYKIELAAFEPMVQDPVVIKFDEDGRLWVVEMRGFMPDINGTGEELPSGRVSVLVDRNLDGLMDSSWVFVDSLVLPRALALVENGALVAEEQALWFMEDADGDLKAERRILIDPDYGKKGVVEHSPNSLWRGMDNWYYNAKSSYRYRQVDGQWVKEETEFRGQWGMSHDNQGRLYYNYNWSQLHIDLVPPNYLSRNPNHKPTSGIDHSVSEDRRIFPVRPNQAINRGYIDGTLNTKGSLIEFTSACAPFVYRGHVFSPEVIGDVFVCEPTGNLIKHNKVTETGIYPTASNAYKGKEFLASTDERFRPVWLASGPDGFLYIADMYRGIIQHGLYMSDYLKEITQQRKLDQHINLGRIWRIIPEVAVENEPLVLSKLSSNELVDLLSHSNGWYRDMAQRLIVESKDSFAVGILKHVALTNPNYLARLHALWTLEGLNYNNPDLFLQKISDQNEYVQVAALRILGQLAEGNPKVIEQFEQTIKLPMGEAASLQLALSASVLKNPGKHQLFSKILTQHLESQLFRDAIMSSIPGEEYQFLRKILDQPSWQSFSSDKEIMIELLATAVANNRDHKELTALINLVDKENLDWKHHAIITGLSFHNVTDDSSKIPLKSAPEILISEFEEEELGSKVSRINRLFNWPGKVLKNSEIATDTFEQAAPEFLAQGRNLYLSICSNCHGTDGKGLPRFAPPLVASEWVLGDPEQLTRILLHGMEGPVEVNGKTYDTPDILPVMPAFNSTPEKDLAAVMTYIRQEWGHKASAIAPRTMGGIRVKTQGKVTPWSVTELMEIPTKEN